MGNNEDRGNRKKKEEKFDISISNHETGFLNFHRFIAFTTSCDSQKFYYQTLRLVLYHNIKNSQTCDIYGDQSTK